MKQSIQLGQCIWRDAGMGGLNGEGQRVEKEEIWGEIAKTRGHLKILMETYYGRSFLKYTHV